MKLKKGKKVKEIKRERKNVEIILEYSTPSSKP
jgi:hypothetical protein